MSPAGITFLDHTADVGIDVEAPSIEGLFHRAAIGMLALLRGEEDEESAEVWPKGSGDPSPHTVPAAGAAEPHREATTGPEDRSPSLDLEAPDPVGLLADWLRELLFLHEVRHLDYVAASFETLSEHRLTAHVELEPSRRAVREIKGVTYHDIGVRRLADGWRARVIFDV